MSYRADLLSREALEPLPASVAAREEALSSTDMSRVVESMTVAARVAGVSSPRTSPGAFAPFVTGAGGVDAMRQLQRSRGNRYVGRVLQEERSASGITGSS